MNKASIIFSAIILATSAQAASSASAAGTPDAPQNIEISGKTSRMDPQDFYKFEGSYDLSNGKSLVLFSRMGRFYAVVRGEARHRIVATGANTFVALDNALALRIEFNENGEGQGELLVGNGSLQSAKVDGGRGPSLAGARN
jgi:hypothetical protein